MVRIRTILNMLSYAISLLGFAPVFPYIDMLPRLVFLASCAAGVHFDRRGEHPLRGVAPTAISLVFFAYYAMQFSMANPSLPVVNILVILLGIRLLSEKEGRNYLQIFALSLFLLAGSSLLSLSAAFLIYLILQITFIALSLVLLTFHSSDSRLALSFRDLKKVLSVSLTIPALSLLLMIFFFFILPRTEYPLWNFLNPTGGSVAGFSEKVAPGTAQSVGELKRTAFRVECGRLSREDLYWRGIVLNGFEGSTWVRGEPPSGEAGVAAGGSTVRQTVYPEPNRSRYLIALNVPQRMAGIRESRSPDCVHTAKELGIKRVRYEAMSAVTDRIEVQGKLERDFYLGLPQHLPPRTALLAKSLFAGADSDAEKLSRLKDFYLSQRLSYSTRNLPTGEDSLDRFLFEGKSGHCEFFASSFALILRLGGVPSRLVGGYYGGEYNELGGYYIVTEDSAHVWVEAYIEGKGWLKVDPSGFAANPREVGGERKGKGVARRIAHLLDALGYQWNRAVIAYDLEKQIHLLSRANAGLRRGALSFSPQKTWLWGLLPLAAGALLLLCGRLFTGSAEERVLASFYRRVRKRYGPDRVPSESGLLELASALDDAAVKEFAAVYYQAVFRDRGLTRAEIRRLKEILKEVAGGARR